MNWIRFILPALVLTCSSWSSIFAQTWTLTSAPSTNWTSVASSADGSKLVALAGVEYTGGAIFLSTNSGSTWTPSDAPSSNWVGAASSADGTKLVAVVGYYAGPIYVSTNSGLSWTQSGAESTNAWVSVASSADGSILVAAATPRHYIPGEIDVSTNGGATWMRPIFPSYDNWSSVASSADGITLAAASVNSVYVSTNSGVAWTNLPVPAGAIASSADGTRLVAVASDPATGNPTGRISISTNSGVTWTVTSAPGNEWTSVASSADGSKLAAVANNSPIYTSTNAGATWISVSVVPNVPWVSVASSADGSKLVAATSPTYYGNPGQIYTLQTTPTPTLNISQDVKSLVISWIIPSTSFGLQQNPDLNPTNWTDLSVIPVLDLTKLQHRVTIPVPVGTMFYRLKSS